MKKELSGLSIKVFVFIVVAIIYATICTFESLIRIFSLYLLLMYPVILLLLIILGIFKLTELIAK